MVEPPPSPRDRDAARVRKGVALALLAAVATGCYFVPFKVAAGETSRGLVVLAIMLVAAVLNTVTAARPRRAAPWRSRVMLETIALFTVLTLVGNLALAASLRSLDAGVASVLNQTQIVFVAVGGWLTLGERSSRRFGVGVLVVLAGLVVMRLPEDGAPAVAGAGIVWALAAALCFAAIHLWTRRVIERIAPVVVNAARLWLTVLALVCVPGNLDALQGMSSRLWLLCAGAALAGPFLSRLSIMYAVRYITASQSALIALLAPVVAFTLDYALLGATPSRLQVLGAAVVLLGVALPVLELARREPSR